MWDTTNKRGAGAYHVRRKAEKFRQGLQNSRAFHHGKIKEQPKCDWLRTRKRFLLLQFLLY